MGIVMHILNISEVLKKYFELLKVFVFVFKYLVTTGKYPSRDPEQKILFHHKLSCQ